MGFTRMGFTPTTGLKNADVFPATPVSEDAAREQFQRLLDQLKAAVNGLMAALENVTASAKIGSGPVSYLAEGGTTIWSQLEALSVKLNTAATEGLDLSAAVGPNGIVENMIHADAVTTPKILDGAVTTDKLLDGAVTPAKLGEMTSIPLKDRTDVGTEAQDELVYDGDAHTLTLSVAEITPAQICPVVYGTSPTPSPGTYPAGTIYIQYVE